MARVASVARRSKVAHRIVRAPILRELYQLVRPTIVWRITSYVEEGTRLLERYQLADVTITRGGAFFRSPWGAEFAFVPGWGAYGAEGGLLHERAEIEYCDGVLSPGELFLDVGANIGVYSVNLAFRRPDIRCVAFEAVPQTCDWLRRNVERNGLDGRVTVLNKAIGNSQGQAVRVTISEYTGNRLTVADERRRDTATIEMISIDQWSKSAQSGRVGAIKADVEGAEIGVIDGARRVMERDRPIVIVEFVDAHAARLGYSVACLNRLLQELNYVRLPSPPGFQAHNWLLAPTEPRG